MKTLKALAACLCALSLLCSLSACLKDPEGSIVVHKSLEGLIQAAQTEDDGRVDAAGLRESAAETGFSYVGQFADQELGVTVNVNASIEIPETELGVYRVRQKPFEQDFIDRVRAALMGDAPVYEGGALRILLREDVETILATARSTIASMEELLRDPEVQADPDRVQELEDSIQDWQESLDHYQPLYENAPTEVDVTDYPADGQLHTDSAVYALHPEFFSETPEDTEDEALFVVSDGADGSYRTLRVRNSEQDGNLLSYRACPAEYLDTEPEVTDFDLDLSPMPANDTVPEDFLYRGFCYDGSTVFTPYEHDETTVSQEDALATAQAFLEKLGLEDFAFEQGGLFNELIPTDKAREVWPYRHCFIFRFRRTVDGVMVTQVSGEKREINDDAGEDFLPRAWPEEFIELRINDSGVVGFDYSAPLEITETVAENAALRPLAEIQNTFETMVCYVNAVTDPNLTYQIDVDTMRLSYTRISEQDSFDTGLLVPVWSFEGARAMLFSGAADVTHGSFLEINAVDGSIIDGQLGY